MVSSLASGAQAAGLAEDAGNDGRKPGPPTRGYPVNSQGFCGFRWAGVGGYRVLGWFRGVGRGLGFRVGDYRLVIGL